MQVPTIRHTEKEEEEPPLPSQRNPSALRSLTKIKRHGGRYRSPLLVRGLMGHPPAVCSPTDNGVVGIIGLSKNTSRKPFLLLFGVTAKK